MKSFKPWDCIIQTVLIIGSIFYGLLLREFGDFLACYFIVGGWQMISVVAHAASPAHYRIPARKVYLWLLLLTVVSTAIAFAISINSNSDFVIGWLFAILFWTPVLAVFYLVICFREKQKMQQTALPEAGAPPPPADEMI